MKLGDKIRNSSLYKFGKKAVKTFAVGAVAGAGAMAGAGLGAAGVRGWVDWLAAQARPHHAGVVVTQNASFTQ